jgi:hypothetical protein
VELSRHHTHTHTHMHTYVHTYIYIYIHKQVLYTFVSHSFRSLSYDGGDRSFFQRNFYTECDLLLPLSFKYPLVSLRSSGSCLRLLPRLLVAFPLIFPSITSFNGSFSPKCDQYSTIKFRYFVHLQYAMDIAKHKTDN